MGHVSSVPYCKMKKLIFCFILILLSYRPLYIIVFYLLFYFEYVFFIQYAYLLFINRKDYYSLVVKEKDPSKDDFVELWMEICRLRAFSKIYKILLKKKLNFLSLIIWLSIFLLGIPIVMLKIIYSIFVKNKSLNYLYYEEYHLVKHNKIEVLNNKFYLNCFTLMKLLEDLSIKHLSKKEKFILIKSLQSFYIDYNRKDIERSVKVSFILSKLQLSDGSEIDRPHFTHIVKEGALHPTSKIPKLKDGQLVSAAMPSAIKDGSKNPGTIFTPNVKKILIKKGEILIPEIEVDSVLYDFVDINMLPENRYEYIHKKNLKIEEILWKNTHRKGEEMEKARVEIRNNCYKFILLNSNDKEIWDQINEFEMSHIVNE